MRDLEERVTEDLEERVKAGVALLDKKVPRWTEAINLETFNIRHLDTCVLGQLAAERGYGYAAMSVVLGLTGDQSEYGFDLEVGEFDGEESDLLWPTLQELWEDAIRSKITIDA